MYYLRELLEVRKLATIHHQDHKHDCEYYCYEWSHNIESQSAICLSLLCLALTQASEVTESTNLVPNDKHHRPFHLISCSWFPRYTSPCTMYWWTYLTTSNHCTVAADQANNNMNNEKYFISITELRYRETFESSVMLRIVCPFLPMMAPTNSLGTRILHVNTHVTYWLSISSSTYRQI